MKDILNKFREYIYLDPWDSIKDETDTFINELKRELNSEHFLYSKEVIVLARREDCDDILVCYH